MDEGSIMKTAGIFDKVIYEKKKPMHGHIVCHKSGSIFDVDISRLMVENSIVPENFNLSSINVIFDGHFGKGEDGTCNGVAQVMPKSK